MVEEAKCEDVGKIRNNLFAKDVSACSAGWACV